MLDDYLKELEEGLPHSSGSMTLDPARAQEKLRQGRFQHRSEAFLSIIAAAILAGTERVKVLSRGSDLHIFSNGQLPTREEFESLQSALLSPHRSRAIRELGLALNSLYPRHADEVSAELWLGDGGLRGSYTPAGWEVLPIDQPHPHSLQDFPLHIWARRWSLLRHPWRWLKERGADDTKMLQSRTRWAPVPVDFGRATNSPLPWPAQTLALFEIESDLVHLRLPNSQKPAGFHWKKSVAAPYSMHCVILPGDPAESSLFLVYQGITMARHRFLVHPNLQVEGVINADQLTLDASRQHIVENEQIIQLQDQARLWVAEGLEAWVVSQPTTAKVPKRLRDSLVPLLLKHQSLLPALKNLPAKEMLELGLFPFLPEALFRLRLEALPLLDLCDGSQLSFTELKRQGERWGALEHAPVGERKGYPGWLHDRPILNMPNWHHYESIEQVFGIRPHNAWAMLQYCQEPSPPPVPGIRLGPFEGPNWAAILTFPDLPRTAEILVSRKGKPFSRIQRELFKGIPLGVQFVIDGDFDDSFATGSSRIVHEFRQALPSMAPALLDQLMNTRVSGLYFCSFLSLWLGPGKGKPEERWLDHQPAGLAASLREMIHGDPKAHPVFRQLARA